MAVTKTKLSVSREVGRHKRIISGGGGAGGGAGGGSAAGGGGINIPALPDAVDFANMYMVIDREGDESPSKTPYVVPTPKTLFDSMFELVPNGGNPYIKAKYAFASVGSLMAWQNDPSVFPPSIWDAMPKASASQLGGVKVGSGLVISPDGVLSVDGELGGVSSWNDLTDKPAWLTGTTITEFEAAHGHAINKIAGLQAALDSKAAIGGSSAQDFSVRNLNIYGEVSQINSGTIIVDDALLKLNNGNALVDSGLIIDNGTDDKARLFFKASTGRWVFGDNDVYNNIASEAWVSANYSLGGHTHNSINNYLAVNKSTAASEALDVNGNIEAGTRLRLNRTGSVYGSYLQFYREGLQEWMIQGGVGVSDGKFSIRNASNLDRISITQDGKVGINNLDPSEALDVNGNIQASGTLKSWQVSDIRLKQNFVPLNNCIEVISKVPVYSFQYNSTAAKLMNLKPSELYDTGTMAQELQTIPQLKHVVGSIYEKYLGVKYERLVPYLIGAVQELSEELNQLKQQYGITGN